MSNKEEKKLENMSIKEIFDEIETRNKVTPKEKIWKIAKGILLWWPKTLGAIFGIDKETLNSTNKSGQRHGPSEFGSEPHIHPSPQTFREGYKKTFNPYDYDVASQLMYYKLVDGKGDPEPHDCHCDHDNR